MGERGSDVRLCSAESHAAKSELFGEATQLGVDV